MPIATAVPLRHYCQDEFGRVAYEVVHHAFEVHDSLGRIFHESTYRSTLNQILGNRSIQELEICLTHQGFRKELYVDLVVDLGCPFVVPLIRDWGTGLTCSLYLEAIVALAGGAERCEQFTETLWRGQRTGRQSVDLIEPAVAFGITCKKHDLDHYESHLRRFLSNTDLQSILWVNITSGCVRLQRIGP